MTKSGKIAMNLVMLSIFVVMVGIATQYPPQARFMPLVVGIPGLALCLLQLALEFRSGRGAPDRSDDRSEMEKAAEEVSRLTGRKMDFTGAESPQAVATETPEGTQLRREIVMWGYFLGLIGSILLFGFWITVPIFILAFFRFFAETTWTRAVAAAAIATGVFYLAFAKGLGVVLHEGFVVEAIKTSLGLY